MSPVVTTRPCSSWRADLARAYDLFLWLLPWNAWTASLMGRLHRFSWEEWQVVRGRQRCSR